MGSNNTKICMYCTLFSSGEENRKEAVEKSLEDPASVDEESREPDEDEVRSVEELLHSSFCKLQASSKKASLLKGATSKAGGLGDQVDGLTHQEEFKTKEEPAKKGGVSLCFQRGEDSGLVNNNVAFVHIAFNLNCEMSCISS